MYSPDPIGAYGPSRVSSVDAKIIKEAGNIIAILMKQVKGEDDYEMGN